jgi:DNA-nicking Smr family endonuclease
MTNADRLLLASVRESADQLSRDISQILRRGQLVCDDRRIELARTMIKAAHREVLFAFVDKAAPSKVAEVLQSHGSHGDIDQ